MPERNRKWANFDKIDFNDKVFIDKFEREIDYPFKKKLIEKIIKINSEKFNQK
jgi:hypothetical protein